MVLTKKKKILMHQRRICNPNNICFKCGKTLGNKGSHHFFCDDCWVPGMMYSNYIKKI